MQAAALSMGLDSGKVGRQFCLLKCLVNSIQNIVPPWVRCPWITLKNIKASLYAQVLLLRHNIVRGQGKKPSKTAFFKLLNRYSNQIEKEGSSN